MDSKGLKMSKSLGNTISPIDLMRDYGADILRLWALSVDFTEDHRIGKEILAGVADQYRKLRNTFRYLLGALDGFTEEERITDVAAMPELERYMLSLLADLDEPVMNFARPAFTIEGSTPVYEVLREMQAKSVQLAIVESKGSFLGLVTLTDVIKRVLPPSEASEGREKTE